MEKYSYLRNREKEHVKRKSKDYEDNDFCNWSRDLEEDPRALDLGDKISSDRKTTDHNLRVNLIGGGIATTFKNKVKLIRTIMKKTKHYFRILVDDSPAEDFPTLDAALRALRADEYAAIRSKSLAMGHWQGKGEWENFVIDFVIEMPCSDEDRDIYYIEED